MTGNGEGAPDNPWARGFQWVKANAGDALTILTIAVLAAFTILTLIQVPIPQEWLVTAFASVLAALTSLVIADRNRLRGAAATVERISSIADELSGRTLVREVAPDRIGAELESLLANGPDWDFRGGSARWQRSTVLPRLAEVRDRHVRYRAIVISPFDAAICTRYESYRNVSRGSRERPSNGTSVRNEVLGFIYSVACYATSTRIHPEIALTTVFSPLRLDGSKDAMVLTVGDSSKAGLFASNGGWYFHSLRDEFELQHREGKITLPTAPAITDAHDREAVTAFFTDLLEGNPHLPSEGLSDLTDDDWQDVLSAATRETNDA